MEQGSGKLTKILVIVLAIIVVILLVYILMSKPKAQTKIVSNKALEVVDSVKIGDSEEDDILVLKVKNVSDKDIVNSEPRIVYFDENGMAFHEAWGAVIRLLKTGETQAIEFYETIDNYSRIEIGLFPDDYYDANDKVIDYRDKVTFTTKKADEPDEYGETKLSFEGQNSSQKDLDLKFQINYYSGKEWIYEDEIVEFVEANSPFNFYEYLVTEYHGGTPLPTGYTYEVELVEAVMSEDDDTLIDEEFDEEDEEPVEPEETEENQNVVEELR